ncbi:MAG: hypothetical protein RIS76_762 [Verrucomicrobiota bacterium]
MDTKDALGVVDLDDLILKYAVADDSVFARKGVTTLVFEEWDVGPGQGADMNSVSAAHSDGFSPLNSPHYCRTAEPDTGSRGALGGDTASRRPDIQKKPEFGSIVDSGWNIGFVVEPGRKGDGDQEMGCGRWGWPNPVNLGLEGSSRLYSE